MKLVCYLRNGLPKIGVILGEKVFDLREAYSSYLNYKGDPLARKIAAVRIPDTMIGLIRGGEKAMEAASEAVRFLEVNPTGKDLFYANLREVELKAPIKPSVTICGGANFYDHIDETKREIPSEVEFFLKSSHTTIGPYEKALYEEKVTHKYDYEVELGIIIGKPARNVTVEEAFDYVFGYTIFNDISARSRQVIPWGDEEVTGFQLKFGEGKNYDNGGPIGPWVVTKDELPDVSALALQTRINGVLRQNNNTKNLIWNVPHLVSYYSRFMTLEPGLLIATGTPGGPALGSDTEFGADPYKREDGVQRGRYMKSGDVMRLYIEGIGTLENPIV
jgi:2-keto-4-pentenoate hydratase/2-oxohepta-3-ene-1,7-dioic acid hydratase in catechol pathway